LEEQTLIVSGRGGGGEGGGGEAKQIRLYLLSKTHEAIIGGGGGENRDATPLTVLERRLSPTKTLLITYSRGG